MAPLSQRLSIALLLFSEDSVSGGFAQLSVCDRLSNSRFPLLHFLHTEITLIFNSKSNILAHYILWTLYLEMEWLLSSITSKWACQVIKLLFVSYKHCGGTLGACGSILLNLCRCRLLIKCNEWNCTLIFKDWSLVRVEKLSFSGKCT
jgi:hypothetical protein